MKDQMVQIVSQAIDYIETNLHDKLDLDRVANALHYSKFYLHRIFKKTVGLTIHDYIKRRQITESAKLLVYSQKPIIEIALVSGYESQQAFTDYFKAMYKVTPLKFRETKVFYPLQFKIKLKKNIIKQAFTIDDIKFATVDDIEDWMELVRLTVDGYPKLIQSDYRKQLKQYILNKRAFILRKETIAVGIMAFSVDTRRIDFLAVHPQYRQLDVIKVFLDKLTEDLFYGKEISLTTYRAGDKADTGYRNLYHQLGLIEKELLVEYGYPTQRFVLLPKNKEKVYYE